MYISSLPSTSYNSSSIKSYNNSTFGKRQSQISFSAKPPKASGALSSIIEKVATQTVKIIDTKHVEKLVNATQKHKGLTEKLTSHLIVLGSTILSGFYVLKTLNNKQMDEKKRKTLAVNQGLVWLASTVMAYAFVGWARKAFNKHVIDRFMDVNTKNGMSKKELESLKGLKKGLGVARSIIIIDMVY